VCAVRIGQGAQFFGGGRVFGDERGHWHLLPSGRWFGDPSLGGGLTRAERRILRLTAGLLQFGEPAERFVA
jgi:hypothetical protein